MAKAEEYIEDVKRYDSSAALEPVKKIVNYCGIALRSRDSSLVSCTDEAEKTAYVTAIASKNLVWMQQRLALQLKWSAQQ